MNEFYSREKFDKAQSEEEKQELLEMAHEEAVRENADFDYSARQKMIDEWEKDFFGPAAILLFSLRLGDVTKLVEDAGQTGLDLNLMPKEQLAWSVDAGVKNIVRRITGTLPQTFITPENKHLFEKHIQVGKDEIDTYLNSVESIFNISLTEQRNEAERSVKSLLGMVSSGG